MTPEEAVARLNTVLAHAWMIRTFLKHADEIQESEDMLDVPRTLYDSIRAVEPAFQRGDLADFLRRLKGKLPKLRRAAEYFAAHFKEFSPHTNFEMAVGVAARVWCGRWRRSSRRWTGTAVNALAANRPNSRRRSARRHRDSRSVTFRPSSRF